MKIDVSKIEGYAEMSAEEKLAALEGYEFETQQSSSDSNEVKNLKDALSKANSQAAEWKRQFREKQTEQERAEAERAEREKATQEELQTLRREKTISGYISQCLALGYSQDLAVRAAEAMTDGNAAEVFNCQKEFLETKQKEIESSALNRQPTLTVGTPPTAKEVEKEAQNKTRGYFGLPPLK